MKTRILPLVALLASFSSAALAHSTATPSSGNPYGVAIRINDQVITNFELDQRILLLKAFGSTGDLKKLAQEQLIDDRLRLQAASLAGLEVTEEDLQAGITEFAARGKLTGEQLLQYLAARGAAPESMRDFVRAGVVWRTVVRSRFGAKANISDSELDATLNLATNQVQESVLVSEIQIPLRDGSSENAVELAERLSKTITSEAAFSSAARRYSRAPSRGRGGRLDWVSVSGLPPTLAGQILALQPGEVTAPVTLTNSVGIFLLRGVRQDKPTAETKVSISYTEVPVPNDKGRSVALALDLINDVDTCADLRAQSERFGAQFYTDNTADVAEIPASAALALARLDRNEATYYTGSNGASTVIMLCDRLRDLPEGTRDNIRNALFNQRITGFGDGYLQELRGDAVIIYK